LSLASADAEGAVLPTAHYAQVTVDSCVFILQPAHETNQPEIAMFSVLVWHDVSTQLTLNKTCITKQINSGKS